MLYPFTAHILSDIIQINLVFITGSAGRFTESLYRTGEEAARRLQHVRKEISQSKEINQGISSKV